MSKLKNKIAESTEDMILNVERQLISYGVTKLDFFITAMFEMGQTENEAIDNLCKLFPQLNKNEVEAFVKNYSWN